MASLISEVTLGQSSEFIARLGRAGFDLALLKKALGDDALVERMVEAAQSATVWGPGPGFRFWNVFQIGGMPRDGLIARLRGHGVRIGPEAPGMLLNQAFTTATDPRMIVLAHGTVEDLGFTECPTTTELFDAERLARHGLRLCPAEVGPHASLVFWDPGNRLSIGMEPIIDADGFSAVFMVGTDTAGPWLDGRSDAGPEDRWDLDERLIFAVVDAQ